MFQKLKFDKYKIAYRNKILSDPNPEILLWFETMENCNSHWDIEALDFRSMFNKSFKSTISTKLWRGNDYHPKEVMLEFIDYDREIVRTIFRELFDERKDVGRRMERFVFYCDQLLQEVRAKGSKFPGHYHSNYFMVSLYLTFNNPEEYTFYDFDIFKKSMEAMGSSSLPVTSELVRYFKVVRIIGKFLSDTDDLHELFLKSLSPGKTIESHTLFMTYDFLKFVARNLSSTNN